MSKFDEILRDLSQAVARTKKETQAYDTTATVVRVEGDTAWVHIAGGVDETPIKLTVDAKAGDEVQVRIGGGRAWITGNSTAPPTDDTKAKEAEKEAELAKRIAKGIQSRVDAGDFDNKGVIVSATPPRDPFIGMLWKNIGDNRYVLDGTYRWNGTSWELFYFSAVNIEAESFEGYNFTGVNFEGATGYFDQSFQVKGQDDDTGFRTEFAVGSTGVGISGFYKETEQSTDEDCGEIALRRDSIYIGHPSSISLRSQYANIVLDSSGGDVYLIRGGNPYGILETISDYQSFKGKTVTDLDDLNQSETTFFKYGNNTANAPTNASGVGIHISYSRTGFEHQVALRNSSGGSLGMYVRMFTGSSWTAWKTVTLT